MSDRKFILDSVELGRVTLQDDPEGWDTVKKNFTRNLKYIGIFRKRTAALKFIGDGLDYCVELFELKGTEAILNVTVMQKVDYEDAWELEYEGIAKFNPFDLEWENDLAPTLTVEFEDSGFHNKFITRSGIIVNTGEELSIEGTVLGPMPTQEIQLHQRQIQEKNNFDLQEDNNAYFRFPVDLPPPYIQSPGGHVIPAEKIEGETEFVVTPTDYLLASPGLIVEFVTQKSALTIVTNIIATGNLKDPTFDPPPTGIHWSIRIFHDSSDLTLFTDTILFAISGVPPFIGDHPFSVNFTTTNDIQLNIGEALTIVCLIDSSGPDAYDIIYSACNLNILLIQNFDEYLSKCHYRFEFLERLIQLTTDQKDCLRSSVFGRSDIGYVTEGVFWNNVVMNGKQIRGFNEFPSTSFDKSFQSVKSIWNCGCGIEKVGSKFKVVIEELPYFFKGDISITLHHVRKIKRGISEDFTFSEVRVGYEKAEYEQVNGLEEYNNKSVFSTFIKSNTNILDLISPDRADGYGIEFARRKSRIVAASEDTPYDQEVFTVMVNKEDGILKSQKAENYDEVLNIQSPESATNLDITPQRNLFRNGDWIKGCVNKYPDEFLKFVSADKTTDLSSTRTGSSIVVLEQTSVLNSALKSSLWLNLNYMFEADITPAQVAAMELKPNSLIKFSPFSREQTRKYYYGWIIDVAVGGKERNGTFTLLAANVTSDRLRIIDPDGIDITDPTTPLPPATGEEFGFEYIFEKVFEA